jgi:hypothetical protein
MALILCLVPAGSVRAADAVPPVIDLPGTQPQEVSGFESPDKCDNCHGGYDDARVYSNEPAFGWRGSAMGNAGRDPIFWATLAIAEQDFDGVGDLCIRCHSTGGWNAGRSTPTDGSGLAASDDDGVDCDTCHKATNPDNTEHQGVMLEPFVANDSENGGTEGYYGSGMLSVWGGSAKLGPYDNAEARHQFMKSDFHRGTDPGTGDTSGENICGTCHDVSNSAVGHYAPNHGAQPDAVGLVNTTGNRVHPDTDPITQQREAYVGLNNPAYAYGVVERTYSEWRSGGLDTLDVRDAFDPASPFFLPEDLRAPSGAINMNYQSAMLAGGTYEDGTVRTFTCLGCHMRADIGVGCNKNVPTRSDLPKHDLTGGNYWMWPLIKYQDQQGTLRLGGGLTQVQLDAMDAGQIRGQDQLRMAATIEVVGDAAAVKITNLTGHKLITGYPEGRRMWLNIKWYDANGDLIREDGAYGPLFEEGQSPFVNPVDNQAFNPQSILDLSGTNTRIIEVHPAISQDWAVTLSALGLTDEPIGYDRLTGDSTGTIGELAAGQYGAYAKSFHFVLNNYVADDNRIPPYGMSYDKALVRNALPVPETQFGNPGPGGIYEYWDTVPLNKPATAANADITLYYQGTSWEYVQFLWLANNGTDPAQGGNAFLGMEGEYMLDAWINADPAGPMVPPFPMATATWGETGCSPSQEGPYEDPTCTDGIDNDCDGLIDVNDPDCDPPNQMLCGDYADKGACNNDPNCEWQGSPKNGTCVDAVVCEPTSPTETGLCTDGIDNDCDGVTDCADSIDCGADAACQTDCSIYTTRALCNNQPACSWSGKNKVCLPL